MKSLLLFLISFFYLHAYEVYIDPSNTLQLQDILVKENEFKEKKNLFFGHTDARVWIKYTLVNPTNTVQEHTLHINNAQLTSVDFYELKGGSFKVYKNGYLIPIKDRLIPSVHYLFRTDLMALEKKTIYISAYSKTSLHLKLTHFTNLYDFYRDTFNDNAVTIALITFLIAFLTFNIVIFLINRNLLDKPLYLYYILYLLTCVFMQIQYSDYSNLLVDLKNYQHVIFHVTVSIVAILLFLFFREILDIKRRSKFFNYLFITFIITHAIILVSFFINDTFMLAFRNVFVVPLGFVTLGLAIIHAIRKKVLYSKYLFVGWFFFMFCASYLALTNSTNITLSCMNEFFLEKGLLLSGVIETTIFSIILALKIRLVKKDNIHKDYLLQVKTKEAQMGEMIGMIAHQWRQPLSAINAEANMLLIQMELDGFTKKGLRKHLLNTLDNVEFLSETINDFRSFFKKDTIPKITTVDKAIQKALNITQSTFFEHKVSIDKQWHSVKEVEVYLNELTQVILNLLKNAEDNFNEKKIKNPKIFISTVDYETHVEIMVCDNGGGVDDAIIETIFQQEFSTKDESIGTGLGLYMCKRIIEEHHKGKIYAENSSEGACFVIKLPCRK